MYDGPTYFAWFVLALLALVGVVAIVWIGSLPGKIAERRNHPQVDAVVALSWFGLLLGGIGWVVAFVWALIRYAPSEERTNSDAQDVLVEQNAELKAKIVELENRLAIAVKTGAES